MQGNQVVSAILALSPTLIAVTALLLNYCGFVSIERRIERMEDGVKQFNTSLLRVENDVSRIQEKLGMASL